MPVALVLGEELPDGGEHHTARFDCKPGAEIGSVFGLCGRLAQQIAAAREGAEWLVVEIIPIRQHDNGQVRHRRLADDAPGVEGHGEALARSLGVPDDADTPIARLPAWVAAGLVAPGFLLTRSSTARRVSATCVNPRILTADPQEYWPNRNSKSLIVRSGDDNHTQQFCPFFRNQ